jgi:DNA-binding transcriptional regulator YhcF (GntR family)
MREAANETGIRLSTTRNVLISLDRLGYIKLRPRKFRAISVLKWPDELKSAA